MRRKCRDYADRFVGIQRDEFRRLGVFAQWDNPYLTKDFSFEACEARELAAVIETGGLYRRRKPVHWCASCATALAEAEVDYDEHRSISVYVAFPAEGAGGALAPYAGSKPAVAIWTTTPWTLPANLAVALNPHLDYVLVEAGERSLLLAAAMVEGLRDKLGLGRTLATFTAAELENLELRHPWIDRPSRIILGDHVTLEAGTGCVHTAPGHGHDDFVVGSTYGLEAYAPVDARGRFSAEVPEFEGRFVFEADPAVVELLAERGVLLASEEIEHSYPHCWRCKKPIIFRATEQWFLSMEDNNLRARALAEIDRVQWIPDWGRERIYGMVKNRPDWCLSRQRAWGVPIIALHCQDCGSIESSAELALHAAGLFESEGADAWFAREIAELLPPGFSCSSCGGVNFERERDILDVWFDSGVSFSAVMESEFGSGVISDLYLEGSDQHRGWFHSALLASVATRNRAPYKAVLTHGFVLDGEGRKMSKSFGNVISPQDIIKRYGADILRLWVAAQDYREDLRISDEIVKRLADSYRRVRNTSRNLLGNLADFDPGTDWVEFSQLPELDRWILGRLHDFISRCREAYDAYEFHLVYHALNNFCSVELSSLYFDIVKDRLYCSARDSRERRAAQTTMYQILQALVRVVAPVMSFTAEEIWKSIPNASADDRADSVFLSDFPAAEEQWLDRDSAGRWEGIWKLRGEVTRALEEKRRDGEIGHSLDTRVILSGSGSEFEVLEALGAAGLAEVFIVSEVELKRDDSIRSLLVEVVAPRGEKCARCWIHAKGVGSHDDHPQLCDRCHAVIVAAAGTP